MTGTVLFVFQPAEEGPPIGEDGGALLMVAKGALDDPAPTMVFGVHVGPGPFAPWPSGAATSTRHRRCSRSPSTARRCTCALIERTADHLARASGAARG